MLFKILFVYLQWGMRREEYRKFDNLESSKPRRKKRQKIMVDNGDVSAYDAHPTRVHDDDVTEYQIAVTF